jgi:microcystin-dependent protein
VAVLAVMSSIMAFGTAKLTQASFNALSSNKKGVQALQLAESKAKILRLGGYANAAAQAKTQVSTTGFYDEVTLGSVTTSGKVSTRTATVNVYGPGDMAARVSLPVYLSSAESASGVPSGTICIWHGSAATIPTGWALCDGSNGTPDLRSRFVYGAGGDTDTKSSWGTGWNNIVGHWPYGWTGGSEQEVMSIAEMPSHNHTGTTDYSGAHVHNFYTTAGGGPFNRWVIQTAWDSDGASSNYYIENGGAHSHSLLINGAGGNAPHNLLPPFMTLCYIMKL